MPVVPRIKIPFCAVSPFQCLTLVADDVGDFPRKLLFVCGH